VKPLLQNETKAMSSVYSFQISNAEAGVKDEALWNVLINLCPSPFLYVEKPAKCLVNEFMTGSQ
jgi:hypothetical protein